MNERRQNGIRWLVCALCSAAACATRPATTSTVSTVSAADYPMPLLDGAPIPAGVTVYGTHGDGCLLDSRRFDPADHPEFTNAFRLGYYHAHKDLESLLLSLGRAYTDAYADHANLPILLSDIAHSGGGQLLPHRSHQLGLDVDLYYFSPAGAPTDSVATGEGVTSDFDLERNWWLAGYIALWPSVDRIFVAPEVKRAFCERRETLGHWPGKSEEILRRLRPWFGHRDHFHVRLSCPRGEPYCFSRAGPIAPGHGCHEVDAWLLDPTHVERRAQTGYLPAKAFNIRCHRPEPNVIANPVKP